MKDKIVLVTGGASGIGYLMAKKFSSEGAKVVVWDVNQQGLEKLESEFKAEGKAIMVEKVDLTSREAIEAAAIHLAAKMGPLDILVNNAGIVSGKTFLECSPEQIKRTMDVNINSHFWTVRSFLPSMIARKSGHVVTIASMAGHMGVPGLADYAASKFAAVGFDESLRVEMKKAKTGVKTTCVCPYYISTGMFEGVKGRFSFLFPILTPDYVAQEIVSAVKRGDEALYMPYSMTLLPIARLLPIPIQDWAADLLGFHNSMDHFVGRQTSQKKLE